MFLAQCQRSEIGCLPYFGTRSGLSANLECRSEMRCTRVAANTGRKKSPSRHHRTTLLGHIFATKECIDKRKSSNTSSTWSDNMANFGPLTVREFGAPLQISTGFASWQRYCTASSSGRQPNFAALNRGRHLCSPGRPSGWALAHISSLPI